MPPQRMLNRVEYHRRWLACLAEARRADQATPHPEVRNREAVRFISVSQPTAAGVLDVAPDGTFSTTVENRTFSTYLQRRGGLNLSAAKAAIDAAAERGETEWDLLGDRLANKTDHNKRHNGVLNKAYDMISAVAIGQVAKGDKSDRDAMARLNSGTVTDIVEYDGDDDTGADAHTEVKVPSPFTSAHRAGKGTETHGGTPTSVGHP